MSFPSEYKRTTMKPQKSRPRTGAAFALFLLFKDFTAEQNNIHNREEQHQNDQGGYSGTIRFEDSNGQGVTASFAS